MSNRIPCIECGLPINDPPDNAAYEERLCDRCYQAWETRQASTVIRYVPTFVNADGMRTLMRAQQGRHTFATPEEAQAWIDAVRANNAGDVLQRTFGTDPRMEVRPCACWPGHFDPIGIYFEDTEVSR